MFACCAALISVLALLVSLGLACQSWEHRRRTRSDLREAFACRNTQRVALFVPCKGLDVGLKENLASLLRQHHANYQVFFIVECETDAAFDVIQSLIDEHPQVESRLVVAGQSKRNCQKVHNLLAATRLAGPDVEIFAFVDSDARPNSDWLGNLLRRLDWEGAGVTTGYRWFVPVRWSLANELLCSINATAASLYSPKTLQPVWGGSWAMRRDVFYRTGLHLKWQDSLTDDLVATNAVHAARMRVEFEPACMIESPLDATFGEMFGFLRRQYLIGRHYLRRWWSMTLLATTLTVVGFWGNGVMLAAGVVYGANWTWRPALVCGCWYVLSLFRASIRRDLAKLYLPDRTSHPAASNRFDAWAAPLTALVNWAALVSTIGVNRMVWRKVEYELLPRGKTRVVDRLMEQAPAQAALPTWPIRAATALPPHATMRRSEPTLASRGSARPSARAA